MRLTGSCNCKYCSPDPGVTFAPKTTKPDSPSAKVQAKADQATVASVMYGKPGMSDVADVVDAARYAARYLKYDRMQLENPFKPADPGQKPEDPVNQPSHYTKGKVECIDAIDSVMAGITDGREAFYTGQVIKYVWRWPLKGKAQSLHKARWYLERLIKLAERAES
jgi:hypothetical protein